MLCSRFNHNARYQLSCALCNQTAYKAKILLLITHPSLLRNTLCDLFHKLDWIPCNSNMLINGCSLSVLKWLVRLMLNKVNGFLVLSASRESNVELWILLWYMVKYLKSFGGETLKRSYDKFVMKSLDTLLK